MGGWGKWGWVILLASSALADCPAHLFSFEENARLAAILNEPAPEQRLFKNYGGFVDYFTTPQGDEVMFGARVKIEGRVLTLREITILPLGATDYQSPVALLPSGVLEARDRILEKARSAGFAVLVLEGDRVSGARRKNRGQAMPVTKVFFLTK